MAMMSYGFEDTLVEAGSNATTLETKVGMDTGQTVAGISDDTHDDI